MTFVTKKKTLQPNNIVALCIISESELAKIIPNYQFDMENTESESFKQLLFSLGIDTDKNVIRQDGLWHRNRFNEQVLCSRYVGYERLDNEWILSGYASTEAKDKASGSRLLEDMYRAKGLTEDRQDALEARDKYTETSDDD